MKLIETRKIMTSKVREMCIRNQYYTSGTNEEYDKMFQKCQLDYSILEIAKDIFEHTDINLHMYQVGCSERELLESICFNLINDCTYTLVDIEI